MRATPACKHLTSKDYKSGDVPTKTCTQHPYIFNPNDLNKGADLEEPEEGEEGAEEGEGELPEGELPADTPLAPGTEGNAPVTPGVTVPSPEPQTPPAPSQGGTGGTDLGI